MPDSTPYQRSVDSAAQRYATAVQAYRQLEAKKATFTSEDVAEGGNRKGEYEAFSKELDAAAKEWTAAEDDYQTAIQLQDKAAVEAKQYPAANSKRTRLDSAGKDLVAITEVADGQGGWSYDKNTPPSKVDIPGVTTKDSVTAAPTSEYILRDGKLEKNEAYKPPQPPPGSAVPTSQFVYGPDGKPVANEAYKPSDVEINTTSEWINDPAHPGQLMKNQNYKKPGDLLTPGQTAVDTATASTAGDLAQANLAKAQADASKAKTDLETAQRQARQAPTDEQAQKAIQTAQQQLDVALAQQQEALNQLRKVNPTLAQQAEANLTLTQQNVEKNKLGDLYGMQDRIKQVRDLIALGKDHGGIDPGDGESMITAMSRGMTVFDAMKQAQQDRESARTQDVSSLNARAGVFGSMANSGLSTFADMNKTGAIGSDATGKAYLGMLTMAQSALGPGGQYAPAPAQQTDYFGPTSPVSKMADLAAQQVAAPVAPAAPVPAPGSTSAPITINIGSGAAQHPQPATPSNPETRAFSSGGLGPVMSPSPTPLTTAAAQGVPATEQDVMAHYPGAAKRLGFT